MQVRRLLPAFAAVVIVATAAFAIHVRQGRAGDAAAEPVRVGTGPEPEAVLLAHVVVALLAAEDIPAEVVRFGHAQDARQAVELGDVDVLPSYTGAVWLDTLGRSEPPREPQASYDRVSAEDERRNPVVWLPATGVNATFAFAVLDVPGTDAWLEDVSDLRTVLSPEDGASPPRLCVDEDFARRPDGLAEVFRLYVLRHVSFAEFVDEHVFATPPEDAVLGVTRGACVAALTTTTDGRAWAEGLKTLGDSQQAFPAFVLAAVVGNHLPRSRPDVVVALAPFALMEEEDLRAWNGQALQEPVARVAEGAALVLRERAGPGRPAPSG